MRLARIGTVGDEAPVVVRDDGSLLDASAFGDFDPDFFASGRLVRLAEAARRDELPPLVAAGDARWGAPIRKPGKIVCIGLNYRDHARETGAAIPVEPIVFFKASNTLIGPNDEVLVPRGSVKTDWEVELAVVIGSKARYLESPDDAASVIAGYAVANDVSEREFQLERGGQWVKGKSCETFNPMGPWLVTPDAIDDPQALGLRLWVNGVQRQNGSTSDMVFSVNHIVWYLSQFMVLDPGDVINTGTPAGVALGLADQPFLRAGDTVELEIDGLGRQSQRLGQA